MFYNRPHKTATWGTMAKDWESGVNYPRLREERAQKAQAAIKAAGLGGVLCFTMDNVRYVTGTHIGEWARDKFDRYAICPAEGPSICGIRRRRPSARARPGSTTISARRSRLCKARFRRASASKRSSPSRSKARWSISASNGCRWASI